jgi:hypothetical protein
MPQALNYIFKKCLNQQTPFKDKKLKKKRIKGYDTNKICLNAKHDSKKKIKTTTTL